MSRKASQTKELYGNNVSSAKTEKLQSEMTNAQELWFNMTTSNQIFKWWLKPPICRTPALPHFTAFYFHIKKHLCQVLVYFFLMYLFFRLFWGKRLIAWSSTYCYFSQEKYKSLHIYLPYVKILSVNTVLWRNSYQYSRWTNANLQWAEQWYEAAAQDIKGQRVSLDINNI